LGTEQKQLPEALQYYPKYGPLLNQNVVLPAPVFQSLRHIRAGRRYSRNKKISATENRFLCDPYRFRWCFRTYDMIWPLRQMTIQSFSLSPLSRLSARSHLKHNICLCLHPLLLQSSLLTPAQLLSIIPLHFVLRSSRQVTSSLLSCDQNLQFQTDFLFIQLFNTHFPFSRSTISSCVPFCWSNQGLDLGLIFCPQPSSLPLVLGLSTTISLYYTIILSFCDR
jgi:hypothetical protein